MIEQGDNLRGLGFEKNSQGLGFEVAEGCLIFKGLEFGKKTVK